MPKINHAGILLLDIIHGNNCDGMMSVIHTATNKIMTLRLLSIVLSIQVN